MRTLAVKIGDPGACTAVTAARGARAFGSRAGTLLRWPEAAPIHSHRDL